MAVRSRRPGPTSALSRESARAAAERAARRLAADPRVQLVYLYGSAADATRSEVRDVDLAVACRPSIAFDELMRLRTDADADAGAPLDVVVLEEAGVVLAWEVAESGTCLFARDPDAEVEFVTRARARYWDFKPFLEAQWKLAGERLAERRRGAST